MTLYQSILRVQAAKAASNRVVIPSAALATGGGEKLSPVSLRLPQRPQPAAPKARVTALKNHDQYENLKLYKPVSAADFIYEGGGLK